jgi:hypothetical protein
VRDVDAAFCARSDNYRRVDLFIIGPLIKIIVAMFDEEPSDSRTDYVAVRYRCLKLSLIDRCFDKYGG